MSAAAILRGLGRNRRGAALIEFALLLPILILLCLAGAEMTHYVTTKMRVSQIALKVADDAARMGTGSLLAAKTISEADINDLFIGAQLQSRDLDLHGNGRVVLSSLEPMANPNTTSRYQIRWQRCFGQKTYVPTYGRAGQASGSNKLGMGPAGRLATATDDNATMFVEVAYTYRPLLDIGDLAPGNEMMEIASMAIRDRRDLSDDSKLPNGSNNPNPKHPKGVYKVAGVASATC